MVKKTKFSPMIRTMLAEGKTVKEIVAKLKCDASLVYTVRRNLNGKKTHKSKKVKGAGIDQVLEDRIKEAKEKMLESMSIPTFLKADPINPDHYKQNGIETINVIEAWGLNYRLGNVVKYVSRANHKGNYLEDLKKARWYLDREISHYE
jgi:hypothetical protein